MLFSTSAIQNLNFGVVFPQKYPSECHVYHMRMDLVNPAKFLKTLIFGNVSKQLLMKGKIYEFCVFTM